MSREFCKTFKVVPLILFKLELYKKKIQFTYTNAATIFTTLKPFQTTSAHPYYVGGHTTSGYQNPAPSAVGSDQTSNSKSSDTNNDDGSSIVEGPAVHSSSKSHNCRKG